MYFKLEVKAIAAKQLAILLGEAVVERGRSDLFPLHKVDRLEHLQTHLSYDIENKS